jgi:hypothetical protein
VSEYSKLVYYIPNRRPALFLCEAKKSSKYPHHRNKDKASGLIFISAVSAWTRTEGSLGVGAEQKSKTCFGFFEATPAELFGL